MMRAAGVPVRGPITDKETTLFSLPMRVLPLVLALHLAQTFASPVQANLRGTKSGVGPDSPASAPTSALQEPPKQRNSKFFGFMVRQNVNFLEAGFSPQHLALTNSMLADKRNGATYDDRAQTVIATYESGLFDEFLRNDRNQDYQLDRGECPMLHIPPGGFGLDISAFAKSCTEKIEASFLQTGVGVDGESGAAASTEVASSGNSFVQTQRLELPQWISCCLWPEEAVAEEKNNELRTDTRPSDEYRWEDVGNRVWQDEKGFFAEEGPEEGDIWVVGGAGSTFEEDHAKAQAEAKRQAKLDALREKLQKGGAASMFRNPPQLRDDVQGSGAHCKARLD
ncbi:unnamed protein product [Amoebophrya sp. A120]|nr:unnamed protein product [Amoebophrya sp. A120]|eukprot:GSA120T00024956001.1